MKVMKAKRRLTEKLGEEDLILCKDDYILSNRIDGDEVVLILGMHSFKKAIVSLEDTGIEVPDFFKRFGFLNLQKAMKLVLLAKEKGYTISDKEIGKRLGKEEVYQEQEYSTIFEEMFIENIEKQVVLVYSPAIKSLKPDWMISVNDKPVLGYVNRTQTVVFDWTTPITSQIVDEFTKALENMKVLSDSERKTIACTKLANAWNSTLKERRNKLTHDLKTFEQEIVNAQLELTQATANIRNGIKESEYLDVMLTQEAETVAEKIKEVESFDFVKGTDFKGTDFIVYLKDFKAPFKYQDHAYNVSYKNPRIVLTPSRVDIFHDEPVKRKDSDTLVFHPHITQGKDQPQFACFGDQKAKVATLLAERKFRELIFLARTLLQSYNEPDCLVKLPEFLELKGLIKKNKEGRYVPSDDQQQTLVTADDI